MWLSQQSLRPLPTSARRTQRRAPRQTNLSPAGSRQTQELGEKEEEGAGGLEGGNSSEDKAAKCTVSFSVSKPIEHQSLGTYAASVSNHIRATRL